MKCSLHRASLLALLLAASPVAALSACGSDPGTGGHGGTTSTTTTSTSTTSTTTTSTGGSGGTGGTGGTAPLPPTFQVTGVVTDGEAPVEGAIVMQAGGKPDFLTGPDGKYTITLSTAIPGIPAVVAAKVGYRSAGEELSALPGGPVDLAMRFVTLPDNPSYDFGDPGTGDPAHDNKTSYCGHCHTTQVKQFQESGHAEATKNPFLQDLYAGVSEAYATQAACLAAKGVWRAGLVPGTSGESTSKCYLGAGVLPDLNPGCGAPGQASCDDPALDPQKKPTAFGRCADCHAPGIDGKGGGRDLHEAVGISYESGNHCDVCHHVRDVDLGKPPGVGGALLMQRSHDHLTDLPSSQLVQVLYGPLPDVPNTFMGGSYAPVFTKSDLCGACHEQRQEALLPGTALDPLRWPSGLPTHSTFSEWAGGSFNAEGTQCQSCHMPPDDTGLKNSVDVTDETNASITFGYLRTPDQLKMHVFLPPLDGAPRLIDHALKFSLSAASAGGAISVSTKIENVLGGHAIPTGEPMRALLLVVHAEACGQALEPSGGMTLDDWGGALAEGTMGADALASGAALTWAEGAALAKPGQRIRAVRPTGMYEDYAGIGFFADPQLSPLEKGIELLTPVGSATVLSIVNGVITLDQALPLQLGDQLYLGESAAFPLADGAAPLALAGSAGHSFARTLLDAQGQRGVPHYRAVDMRSDNRIGPGAEATTQHQFPLVPNCPLVTVSAQLLYRPLPLGLARERGWENGDFVVAQASQDLALP